MKKLLKRSLSILVAALILTASVVSVFAADAKSASYKVKAQSEVVDFKYNDNWFIFGNNEVFSNELSKFAFATAFAIYSFDKEDDKQVEEGFLNNEAKFLAEIGFDDAEKVSIEGDGVNDIYDNTKFLVGHRNVTVDYTEYEIIVCSAQGSSDSTDWISNFDIGCDTENYDRITGKHPEWTDRTLHKGFCVTANRCQNYLENYISKNVSSTAKKLILITGHSRGASIANILGKNFHDKEDYKSFTYTFGAAGTTIASQEECDKYTTIFNVINTDDIVPGIPSPAWGNFKRFGKDLKISVVSEYGDKYLESTGEELKTALTAKVASDLGSLMSSREDLYKIDKNNKDCYASCGDYLLRTKAEKKAKEVKQALTDSGLIDYVEIVVQKDTIGYDVGYYYCPAFALDLLSGLLIDIRSETGIDAAATVKKLIKHPLSLKYYGLILDLAMAFLNGSFLGNHFSSAYVHAAGNSFGYNAKDFLDEEALGLGSVFGVDNIVTIVIAVAVAAVLIAVVVIARKKKDKKAE